MIKPTASELLDQSANLTGKARMMIGGMEYQIELLRAQLAEKQAAAETMRTVCNEAAAELASIADELKLSSTVGGEWDGTEEAAKEEYDRLMNLAGRLMSAQPAGCGACGDGCKERGSCRLADESPEMGALIAEGE